MDKTRKSNDYAKILCNFPVQTVKHLLHNRHDTVLINYKEQISLIIDIAMPRNENKKIDKYQSLKIELEQLWKV